MEEERGTEIEYSVRGHLGAQRGGLLKDGKDIYLVVKDVVLELNAEVIIGKRHYNVSGPAQGIGYYLRENTPNRAG